jgi:hypothetical protein
MALFQLERLQGINRKEQDQLQSDPMPVIQVKGRTLLHLDLMQVIHHNALDQWQ